MKNILLTYCIHGNELITEEVANYFHESDNIDIYLGNPEARKQQERFIETDLNRSFGKSGSYESARADEITSDLKDHTYDLIIDLHTTKAKTPPYVVITDLSQLQYASKANLNDAFYVSKEFSTGGSFIEAIPRAFSIEVHANEQGKQSLIDAIQSVLSDRSPTTNFHVYELTKIVKGEPRLDLLNMQKLPDGEYPLFAGETSYKGVSYLSTKRYNYRLK